MDTFLITTLIFKARAILRITTYDFDEEIADIILAGYYELQTRGIKMDTDEEGRLHPMIVRALMTYVRLHFGDPDDPERLRTAYENQLGQLMTTTGFTDWGAE